MDQFNLARYANLTVQRVQPPEEKPIPKVVENEEDCSEEDEFSGSEEEANKTLEIPKVKDDSEVSDIPAVEDKSEEVKLESENVNEPENNEKNEEEIEANSKRKSGEEEDDQTSKKAKINEDSKLSFFFFFENKRFILIGSQIFLGTSDEDPDGLTTSDKRPTNLRRNIREVMDETKLDESTLAAQRQEMERLRRVQEQQRIIREVSEIRFILDNF